MSGRTSKRRKSQPNDSCPEEEQPAAKTPKKDGESMFSIPWQNSDAVLVVEDKELHVHISVLSIASKYFEKMFNGNFKEAQSKRVTLEGKEYELVEHLLRITYPIKARLEPQLSLLCQSCLPKPDGFYAVYDADLTLELKLNDGKAFFCADCGQRFYKSEADRKYFLKYLQTLYQLTQEFIIDDMAERLKTEVLLQSQTIQSLDNGFDIFETADLMQLDAAKRNCRIYFRRHLTSLALLEKALRGRNISLESRMQLKGILMVNLVKQVRRDVINAKIDQSMDDILAMATEFRSFNLERELSDGNDDNALWVVAPQTPKS